MADDDDPTKVIATAPGKVVLSGEYAVLDGAPAICVAIDRRACVTISRTEGPNHTVTSPGFSTTEGRFNDVDGEVEWLDGGADFTIVDAAWSSAHASTAASYAFELDTRAFFEPGSGAKWGVGSSAALTVALTAALCDIAETIGDVPSIAFAAHRQFQGGLGSGVDIACSLAGGLVEYRMGEGPGRNISWPDDLYSAFIWTGVSANTGAKLERLRKQGPNPSRDALVLAAKRLAMKWREGKAMPVLEEYRDYIEVLREFSRDHDLGVFRAGHAELTTAADAAGIIYKPCGAGGGDVGVALSDDPNRITAFAETARTRGLEHLDMMLDERGVEVTRETR